MIDIIAEIIKIQAARGLNDTQFCALLGQTGANWSRVKNRKREPTNEFMADVLGVMPELWDEIVAFLVTRAIKGVVRDGTDLTKTMSSHIEKGRLSNIDDRRGVFKN